VGSASHHIDTSAARETTVNFFFCWYGETQRKSDAGAAGRADRIPRLALGGYRRAGQRLHLSSFGFRHCQPSIISINAVTLIVAKLENVSDTAYGKMISLLWRIAPHV
jgi:hypothetical protein